MERGKEKSYGKREGEEVNGKENGKNKVQTNTYLY
jgi:hypothetical protein